MDPYALTPFRPAVKLTVCLPHHVGHTVGVCKKHNSSYSGTHSQYERPADAVDNMQASRRPVAADLTVAIQTPRLNITVAPDIPTRRRPTVSVLFVNISCAVTPLQCNPVIRFIRRSLGTG